MRRALGLLSLAIGALLACATSATAQTLVPPGRLEIGFGPAWFGEASLGSSDASETTATTSTSRLFSTSSTLTSTAGLGVTVNVRVWRELEVEAAASVAKPTLATTISHDLEGAAGLTAAEDVRQYVIGGGGLWYLPYGRRSRLRTFVGARGSYLRQLHGSNTLAVTGRTIDFGGGVKYALRSRPKGVKVIGIRGDARVAASTKGVGFDDRTRYAPLLGASLFVRF